MDFCDERCFFSRCAIVEGGRSCSESAVPEPGLEVNGTWWEESMGVRVAAPVELKSSCSNTARNKSSMFPRPYFR